MVYLLSCKLLIINQHNMLHRQVSLKNRLLQEMSGICYYFVTRNRKTKFYKLTLRELYRQTEFLLRGNV